MRIGMITSVCICTMWYESKRVNNIMCYVCSIRGGTHTCKRTILGNCEELFVEIPKKLPVNLRGEELHFLETIGKLPGQRGSTK